jgi:hypothetical protein
MDDWDYKEISGIVGQRIIHTNRGPLDDSEEEDHCLDIIAFGLYELELEHVVIYRTFDERKSVINVAYAHKFLEHPYTSLGKFLDAPERINTACVHVKTDYKYVLLYEGTFHMNLKTDTPVAIYQEANPKPDSVIWVRDLSLFNDGRFNRHLLPVITKVP